MSDIATPPVVQTDAGLIARLGAQKQKFKAAWSALKERSDLLDKQVKDLTTERDALLSKTDVSAAAKRVDELTAELRGLKHRAAFDSAALKSGAKPEALEDLWKLSEVKPEADAPDAAALQAVIDKQKTERAWAFTPPETPADPNAPPPPKPAVGSGQGSGTKGGSNPADHDPSDIRYWMTNFDKIAEGSQQKIAAGQV